MTPISQHWDSNLSTSIQQSIRCNCIAGANFQQGNFPTRGLKGDSFHCDPTWVHIVCVIWTSEQTIYTIDINWHEMFVWHPITCWIENGFSLGKAHYKLGRLDHSVCVYRCAFMPVTQKCWRVSKIKPLHHLFQMVSFNSTKFNPKSMSHKVAETMDPSSPWRTGPPTLLRCRNPRPGQRRAADPTTPQTWPLRWFTDTLW